MTDFNVMKNVQGMHTFSRSLHLLSAPYRSYITPGLCAQSIYSKFVPALSDSKLFLKQKTVCSDTDLKNQTGAGSCSNQFNQDSALSNTLTTEQLVAKMKHPICNIEIQTEVDSPLPKKQKKMSKSEVSISKMSTSQKSKKSLQKQMAEEGCFRFFNFKDNNYQS